MPKPSPSVKVGYRDIRGLGEYSRLLIHFYNLPIQFINYSGPDWIEAKETLGFAFPNLPYLIDESKGIKISQSNAVTRYVAKMADPKLLGKNEKDAAIVEMLQDTLVDMRSGWGALLYRTFDEEKDNYYSLVQQTYLKKFEQWFQDKPRQFLAGDYLTYVDFIFYELLDGHTKLYPDILRKGGFKNLETYFQRLKDLPKMQDYKKTQKQRPYAAVIAKWGNEIF
eukprot:Sdes_comp18916_c0_seq1m9375